ncbi:MAG: MmcB family DNA repair protein [Actinomycetota bacterium]
MADGRAGTTATLGRGARRLLAAMNAGVLPEFVLPSGRRVDLMALLPDGRLWAVEVKSGIDDFHADIKWPEYREWCDGLLFAVSPGFPLVLLPEAVGVLVADSFDAHLLRPPEEKTLHPLRRKALTLKFGLVAAQRLKTGE